MSSTRLPGKVLAPVLGEPMIGRQIERIRRSRHLDALVIATSEDPSDDALADYGRSIGVEVIRGSLTDVLSRYIKALDAHPDASALIRLTADCPLADWRVLDALIEHHQATGADYTNNTAIKSFPHGLDMEAMAPSALRRGAAEATAAYDHEHVTPYLYSEPGRFRTETLTRAPSLAHLRWTVDYPEDLDFVRHVYEALYPADPDFGTEAVAALPWNSSRAVTG